MPPWTKSSPHWATAVELLGFGEALHGGEEILILRNRLFQRLVEAHGYTTIAIESSFPQARLVNDYIAGRGPASYEAVQDAGFSRWLPPLRSESRTSRVDAALQRGPGASGQTAL